MNSSCPLSGQLATLNNSPSSSSGPIVLSNSGEPNGAPLPTSGIFPLLSLTSSSFQSISLQSGMAEVRSSRKSGLAERTLSTSGVASDSGGVKIWSTTALRPAFSMPPPSRSCLPKLTGEAVLSWITPIVFGRLPVACSASLSAVGRGSAACQSAGRDVLYMDIEARLVVAAEYEEG